MVWACAEKRIRIGNSVMAMEVAGKRRRGRPKRRWLDSIRNDLSESELSREDTQDRDKWRRLVCPYPVSVLIVFLSCRKMSHN